MPKNAQNTHEVQALIDEYGPYVTVPQAERITTVSARTLGRLTDAGDLPLYRIGRSRSYRYKTADVAALIQRVA